MPNIVQLWDFETGDPQGWELVDGVLDDTGALAGTYSLKGKHFKISNIDLSSVSKPILVFLFKGLTESWTDHNITVKVYDASETYINITLHTRVSTWYDYATYKVFVVDLSSVQGKTGLTIEIICDRTVNIDNVAIIDGADYEYNTGVVASDNEDKYVEVDVPDGDLSGINIDRFGICLTTPDWRYTQMSAEAITNQGSATIDSNGTVNKHGAYTKPDTAPTLFQKLKLRVKISIGAYDGWLEKIAVVFLDSGWNYKRIYLFIVYYTANGVSPRYVNAVNTTTYGSTASGSKDINVRIHGNKFSVALKVKYLVGEPSIVSVGSVKLTVYSSDKSTNYGSVTIDLTVASEQVSGFIDNLPTDTDLIFTIEWSITASARVVLLVVPLVKVS
ncbi:MAG: hypothetical protein DRI01_10920 [Chloroflexi bacterium]|mgnify:CR=1 FL=1|nr:MAG: hypothetical protein DRI01_10920 [Chloroflexota bacterium]